MKKLIAIFCTVAVASSALATTLPFSTGFEAAEGYTNGTQLATNANWTGDGQDTGGWQVTNSTVGGSAAAAGTQWVLTSGATATTSKFQWTVTPVTDFSTQSIIEGSADVKLVSPTSGTINRTMIAGIQMYDAAVTSIAQLYLIHDAQNLLGGGANKLYVELDFGDDTGVAYDLGVTNGLNTYYNLALSVDFATDTVTGYVDGIALPDTGSTGGASDFHDFDLFLSSTTTAAGTRGRAGFDNYMVRQVPEPASLGLLALGALFVGRRR